MSTAHNTLRTGSNRRPPQGPTQSNLSGRASRRPGTGFKASSTAQTKAFTNQTSYRYAVANTSYSAYRYGEIVEFAHVVPALDPRETRAQYKVPTRAGDVCPKIRKGIVQAIWAEKMDILPLFSSGENGVDYKSDEYQMMAMSIIHPHQVSIKEFKDLLTPDPLLVQGNWAPFKGSHINLNETLGVYLAYKIKKVSQLDLKSTELLRQRYKQI